MTSRRPDGGGWRAAPARTSAVAFATVVALLLLAVPAVAVPVDDVSGAPPTSAAPAAAGGAAPGAAVPGTLVVRADGPVDVDERLAIARVAGGVPGQVIAPDTFVVRVSPTADLDDRLADVADADGVVEAQRELVYAAADTEPDDPCWRGSSCLDDDASPAFGGQVEMRNVGAPRAWDRSRGSADIVVAVLDTKIETDPPHRDLVGKLVPGASFVGDRTCAGAARARDHGTIAAGLIAAQPANGTDIAGLGWDTVVLPVEVLDDCGSGTTSGVAAGIRWAADRGADIINLSLTGSGRDPAVSAAVAYARTRDVLVVAAAGNQGTTNRVFPAADLGVVAVAATGLPGTPGEDRLAPYSNRGPWVDIAAPGTDVIGLRRVGGSTNDFDGTTRASGTSFAAPLVAAAAALVMAEEPSLSSEEVARRLAQTAVPLAGGGAVLWGRLDAAAALSPLPVGYRLTAADGGLFTFGDAPFTGSGVGRGTAPLVGASAHPSGRGYWLARSDGRVDAFGSAPAQAPVPTQGPINPVVGIAGTNGGDGYWLATRDGRVLTGGVAPHLGSKAGTPLKEPIVGLAASRRGDGYWLVARDGGIFSFGSAAFLGSTGATRLSQPIVGMASTPSGAGYWLVARDGGIFSFGDAAFFGSTGATRLNRPIVGMTPTSSGRGYWLVAADGGIFSFGDARFLGSTGAIALNQPIVAMTPR